MELPKIKSNIAWRELGDHILVLDTKGAKKAHRFNEVASYIWKLCDGAHDIDAISGHLSQEYDIDQESAKDDVREFLDNLKQLGLLDE